MKFAKVALLLGILLSQALTLGVASAAPTLPPQSPATIDQPQTAPTVAPTAPVAATLDPTAAQDPGQETAAIIIIWSVIILVTALTIFLIWWTRPGRHPLRGRSEPRA
jgi:hypothetical protein